MTVGEFVQMVEDRRAQGVRYNTVVCRPRHLDAWDHVDADTLRLVLAEHGLRLQVDAFSPWSCLSVLWIDSAAAIAA